MHRSPVYILGGTLRPTTPSLYGSGSQDRDSLREPKLGFPFFLGSFKGKSHVKAEPGFFSRISIKSISVDPKKSVPISSSSKTSN